MKTLPSESQRKVKDALRRVAKKQQVILREPCDCEWQIRHNNGGNYHERVAFEFDRKKGKWVRLREVRNTVKRSVAFEFDRKKGKWYKQRWTTCEFEPEPEWQATTESEVRATIEAYADWL
jgi:hypothetical protein